MRRSATEELKRIVGGEFVSEEEAVLEAYSFDLNVSGVRPRWVCSPKDGSEIVQIVAWARENGVGIVPVSSGPPHFRGDTVPSVGSTLILDLSRMKRIIRVDRKNRVAMFEPGVTFGELKEAVEKNGLRLNMPLLPRRTKSVLGSLLEREPVTMPKYQWDAADPLTCLEIVTGTGEIMRTGSGAGPGDIEEQWQSGGAQKEAAGPSAASWYRIIQGAQGTMGIVTWATTRCEVLPRKEAPFFVASFDLERLLSMVHWLIRLRLANECFILNNVCLSAITSSSNPSHIFKMSEELPRWVLFLNLAAYEYFPERRILGQIEDLRGLSKTFGLEPRETLGGLKASAFQELVKGPSPEPYWKLRFGGCEDLFFITRCDKIVTQVRLMEESLQRHRYPLYRMGIYIQPLVQGANYHVEFSFFSDPKDRQRVGEILRCSLETLLHNGAFFSRPYGEWARRIMMRDASQVAVLKKIKKIMDPWNVMNPGKLCF